MAVFALSVCQKEKSKDNTGTILALVQTQNLNDANSRSAAANASLSALNNSLLGIQGFYNTGFYSGGTFTAGSGRLVVSAGTNGVGSWASASPTTSGTFGRCGAGATASSGTSGGSDSFYRIVQFSNTTNTLILQTSTSCDWNFTFADNRSTYSKMIVTPLSTTGCENGATACFSYCEITSGNATLAGAVNDTKTANSLLQTTTGCGGFGWSRALLRTDINTWN